jgi:pimeloyl-ACP methyl ester carboxylesterase
MPVGIADAVPDIAFWRARMTTSIVERMAVEVEGSGEVVVMVHGLGGTSNVFTPQMDVTGRMRSVRPDLPGSGRSPANGPLSIQTFVDRVVATARTLGVDRAHFVGHSMGTIVCCHIAEQHPSLVRSLALLGPLLAPSDAARQGLRDRAAKARAEGMAPIADAIVQAATSADTKSTQPVTVALVREFLMRQDAEGYAKSCEALAAAQPADVSRIKCKTMLITGDEDVVTPPSGVRAMAERMDTPQTIILNRCGHWTGLERTREVNQALRSFYFGRA